jgi:L-alanine-DL-glutamate epimerase-like enolase superfamily enzyme
VDIALWDIAGKAAGAPLHRLLGGGRDDLACYASLDAYADPDLVRAAVRNAVDAGFSGVKLHERDLPVVRAGREEAGPDVALMIDVNAAWTVNQARAMAERLREVRPKWLEELVWPPENYDGLAQVRRSGDVAMLHSFYDGPGLLAAIHATAALGTADSMIEWRYFDLEATVLGDALTVKDGRVPVPQGPGLGIDPDPDVIRAYLLRD